MFGDRYVAPWTPVARSHLSLVWNAASTKLFFFYFDTREWTRDNMCVLHVHKTLQNNERNTSLTWSAGQTDSHVDASQRNFENQELPYGFGMVGNESMCSLCSLNTHSSHISQVWNVASTVRCKLKTRVDLRIRLVRGLLMSLIINTYKAYIITDCAMTLHKEHPSPFEIRCCKLN